MDFFQHQEDARLATRRLVLLFILAVVAIAGAISLVIALGFSLAGLARPQHLFLTNTLLTALFVGGGSLVEISRLRAGGEVVAQQVGGRVIEAATRDPLERRLLNVVEEMALAAGMAVPRVYVLDHEDGINAFAAGWSVNDAVVAVTRGALTRLQRQELQGVVGHEFSHILNGDMRLNLRLMGVLYGLLMLSQFGRFLMASSSESPYLGERKTLSVFVLLGGGVYLFGMLGVFFGRLIKASVSRHREFLADASAVQFTRDPEGLGGALRKIGGIAREFDAQDANRRTKRRSEPGSRIRHRQAESLSHLFLGAANRSLAQGFLATHPPLEARIARLYGRPMPWLAAPVVAVDPAPAAPVQPPLEFNAAELPAALSPVADRATASVSAVEPAAAVGHPDFSLDPAQQALFAQLRQRAQDGGHARLMLLAMVIARHATTTLQQRELVTQALGAPAAARMEALHAAIAQLPPGTRLPLADLAMPAVRAWPPAEREQLLKLAHALIVADGSVTLPEFLLYTVLKRRLGAQATRAVPVRFRSVAELPAATGLVLSLIAALRLPKNAQHAFAAGLTGLGMSATLTPAAAIRLDALSAALAQLNQLAPLAKPALIKAATKVAFIDNQTDWRAASALRTLAIALDAPLPPRLTALDPI